jgi:hypothetical protein
MENSPLRFLDYDVSLMLADQVRISKEEEARRFHYNLYSLESVHTSTIPGYLYRNHNIICLVLNRLRYKYAGGQWWDVDKTSSKPVQQRINLYEQELKKRKI